MIHLPFIFIIIFVFHATMSISLSALAETVRYPTKKKIHLVKEFKIKYGTQKFYRLENKRIKESSGLAYSRENNGVVWTHNDSGNSGIIYAMDEKGRNLGEYLLQNYPFDWEDMSAFTDENKNYLLLADIGDNFKLRKTYRFAIYHEPIVDATGFHENKELKEASHAWDIYFTFPDNKSFNLESVAVDSHSKTVFIVTKSNNKSALYSLPLKPEFLSTTNRPITAKKVRKMKHIHNATAMDISQNGRMAAILVYGYIYLYEIEEGLSWKKIFKKPNKTIHYKPLFQPEAMTFGQNTNEFYLSSEKRKHFVKIILD